MGLLPATNLGTFGCVISVFFTTTTWWVPDNQPVGWEGRSRPGGVRSSGSCRDSRESIALEKVLFRSPQVPMLPLREGPLSRGCVGCLSSLGAGGFQKWASRGPRTCFLVGENKAAFSETRVRTCRFRMLPPAHTEGRSWDPHLPTLLTGPLPSRHCNLNPVARFHCALLTLKGLFPDLF